MKPSLDDLLERNPNLTREEAGEILGRLNDRYFSSFNPDDQKRQIKALLGLSQAENLSLETQERPGGLIEVTIVSYDYPGVFFRPRRTSRCDGFSHPKRKHPYLLACVGPAKAVSRGSSPYARKPFTANADRKVLKEKSLTASWEASSLEKLSLSGNGIFELGSLRS